MWKWQYSLNRSKTRRHKHGHAGKKLSQEYVAWTGMIQRCTNTNNPRWNGYGGRGIKVCHRWRDSFSKFLEDMGTKPSPSHSMDRIDNDGDYAPKNCRWATRQQQDSNLRRNINISIGGQTKTVAEWARIVGLDRSSILHRIKVGGNPEAAVLYPKRQGGTSFSKRIASSNRGRSLRD